MVIVFSFPEPENELKMAYIIDTAKELFKDMKEVQAHLAIKEVATSVTAIVKGEYDKKLLKRAVAVNRLEMVTPEDG